MEIVKWKFDGIFAGDPQKCYEDDIGSYSTNEIAIYWNSTALYAFAYLDL